MVPEVTLFLNSKIKIVTKFKISLKIMEVRGGGLKLPPATLNKLAVTPNRVKLPLSGAVLVQTVKYNF